MDKSFNAIHIKVVFLVFSSEEEYLYSLLSKHHEALY